MKSQSMYRSKWTMPIALVLVFMIAGCTGQLPPPTEPGVPSATAESASPSTTQDAAASPTEPGVEPTAASQPSPDANVLYQDDFTNKATGWPEADFGDCFIGYHEPEYYHVEIKTPNAKAPVVSIPGTETNVFPDATIELQALTVSGRTATDGDYRYGLAFRRSGDNYYAFTITPTTKKWEVLKSSPSGVTVLEEGVDESIHDLDVDDLVQLRLRPTLRLHLAQILRIHGPKGRLVHAFPIAAGHEALLQWHISLPTLPRRRDSR